MNQFICGKCDRTCASCRLGSAYNQCDTCDLTANRFFKDNTCQCMKGYYDDGTTICKKCYYTCADCNGPLINNCTLCPTDAFRNTLSNNMCTCMAGYEDVGVTLCTKCHRSCLTCSDTLRSADACNECPPTSFRVLETGTGFKRCNCKDKYYDDGINQICKTCDHSCLRCDGSSPSNCLACSALASDNRISSPVSKRCDCKDGFYDDGSNVSCLPCNDICT